MQQYLFYAINKLANKILLVEIKVKKSKVSYI